MLYILGRRPDEFGLVPDPDGFVRIKELLQALQEESGWTYVRQSHINEVLVGKDRPLFQADDTRIRALERKWQLDLNIPAQNLPRILYTSVRRRAHPVVMENGLYSAEGKFLVLSSDRDMALRIGKRRDPSPVLLEIAGLTGKTDQPVFYAFGDLFLSVEIPAAAILGPPVPKEVWERRHERDKEIQKEKAMPKPEFVSPGTFLLDVSRDPHMSGKGKGKKPKGWKEAARKERRRGR